MTVPQLQLYAIAGLALLVIAIAAIGGYALYKVWNQLIRIHAGLGILYTEAHTAAAGGGRPVTAPLLVPLDHSPPNELSGLSRDGWVALARGLLEGLLEHTNGMRDRIRIPASSLAGLPGLSPYGTRTGERQDSLEAFARSLWVAAPLLHNEPELRHADRSVADYYIEYLLRGTVPADGAFFGRPGTMSPTAQVMEAAAICIALRESGAALWEPMSSRERRRVLAWLERCATAATNRNNWRWFGIIVNTFLKLEGARYDENVIRANIADIRSMYADAGWFRDGERFDFYSSWSLQYYPMFWLRWDGDSHPDFRDELITRNDQFLESFTHVFSRRGEIPLWGRSATYRFAAAASLPAAFLRQPPPSLEPGFARRLTSGCILQFTQHPAFLSNGVPSLGFLGDVRAPLDGYSGVASPYWCAKVFCGLYLPASAPFWSAPESEGFWKDPPERYDIGTTGMYVVHDRAEGHSRLYAPQRVTTPDSRYDAEYFDTRDASLVRG